MRNLLYDLPLKGGLDLLDDHLFVRLFLLTRGHVGLLRNFVRQAFIFSMEEGSTGISWTGLIAAADALMIGNPDTKANPFRFDDDRIEREIASLA